MTTLKNQIQAYSDRFTPAEKAHATAELREWFALDTWTVREGLLLLVGIDPLRSEALVFNEEGIHSFENPSWSRITERPGLAFNASDIPRVTGIHLDAFQLEILGTLLRFWVSNPSHTMNSRHAPGYFMQWATEKELQPFWCPWGEGVGLMQRLARRPPQTDTAPKAAKSAEMRQENRYQFCIDKGLNFPSSPLGRMPNGVNLAATAFGISRQSLTEDLKKHIERLNNKSR